jgi:hypothetical protein
MGHYRYPGPRADVPRTLDGLFDGFVDLRDGPRPEQRLSTPTVGPTDWTAL